MRGLFVVALLVFTSCALGDEKADRSCKTNGDCFEAQGERCNTTIKQCEIPPDAGALVTDDEEVEASAPEVSK